MVVSKHLMALHMNPGVDLLCGALENRCDPEIEENYRDALQNDQGHSARNCISDWQDLCPTFKHQYSTVFPRK